jgi:RNA polymerase sigma-70 factor, ECF subfamily
LRPGGRVSNPGSLPLDQDIHEHLAGGRHRAAFELLLERFQHKVFRLSWSILGDPGAAEEMAQEIFLKIWRELPRYRGQAALSTWIYAITRNHCLTERKKLKQRGFASLDEPGVLIAAESRLGANAPASREHDIAALMTRLPAPYRQALTLFYWEEKSYEEVAAMMDLPVGTVKTYLHRARKQLAESLHKEASCQ